jgi:hypothetical protein
MMRKRVRWATTILNGKLMSPREANKLHVLVIFFGALSALYERELDGLMELLIHLSDNDRNFDQFKYSNNSQHSSIPSHVSFSMKCSLC